jgi:hypothetical protein
MLRFKGTEFPLTLPAASRTLDQLVGGAIAGDYTRNKFSIANC